MERDLCVPARLYCPVSSVATDRTILSSPITPPMSILYPELYLPIYLRDSLVQGGREGGSTLEDRFGRLKWNNVV